MPEESRDKTPEPARPGPPERVGLPEAARDGSTDRTTPTPVRQAMDGGDPPAPAMEPDVDGVSIEVDGAEWWVTVMGSSRRGPASAPTDLLLLGFSRGPDAAPELEHLTVGRMLSAMTEDRLVAALEVARPLPDPDRPRTLFQGASERRGRKGGER